VQWYEFYDKSVTNLNFSIVFRQFLVSLKRINKYLNADEIDENAVSHNESVKSPIVVQNATFAWTKGDTPILKNISLQVKKKKLMAIVGRVGTGKTSILSALLGEMEKLKGSVNINGRVAYVPQQAWIQNATLKQNIIFSNEYNENYYKKVIESCALEPDLKVLAAGDMTEIGEKGINLSGGQKQRVSLARAVYSDADIYLLDDPLRLALNENTRN
jgi:ABC-type bacteriocin/lantibiotic exporter with double-glycine peptidase domain